MKSKKGTISMVQWILLNLALISGSWYFYNETGNTVISSLNNFTLVTSSDDIISIYLREKPFYNDNPICVNDLDCDPFSACYKGRCIFINSLSNDQSVDNFNIGCGYGFAVAQQCHKVHSILDKSSSDREVISGLKYYKKIDNSEIKNPLENLDVSYLNGLTVTFSSHPKLLRNSSSDPESDVYSTSTQHTFLDNVFYSELTPSSENLKIYHLPILLKYGNYSISFMFRCNFNTSLDLYVILRDLWVGRDEYTNRSKISGVLLADFKIDYDMANESGSIFEGSSGDFQGYWTTYNFYLNFPVSGLFDLAFVMYPNDNDLRCQIAKFGISKDNKSFWVPLKDDSLMTDHPLKYFNLHQPNLDLNETFLDVALGITMDKIYLLDFNSTFKKTPDECEPSQCYVGVCVDNNSVIGYYDDYHFAIGCKDGQIVPFIEAYDAEFTKESYCPNLGCLNDAGECVDLWTRDDNLVCFAGKWYSLTHFQGLLFKMFFNNTENFTMFCTNKTPLRAAFDDGINSGILDSLNYACYYAYLDDPELSSLKNSAVLYFLNPASSDYFRNDLNKSLIIFNRDDVETTDETFSYIGQRIGVNITHVSPYLNSENELFYYSILPLNMGMFTSNNESNATLFFKFLSYMAFFNDFPPEKDSNEKYSNFMNFYKSRFSKEYDNDFYTLVYNSLDFLDNFSSFLVCSIINSTNCDDLFEKIFNKILELEGIDKPLILNSSILRFRNIKDFSYLNITNRKLLSLHFKGFVVEKRDPSAYQLFSIGTDDYYLVYSLDDLCAQINESIYMYYDIAAFDKEKVIMLDNTSSICLIKDLNDLTNPDLESIISWNINNEIESFFNMK